MTEEIQEQEEASQQGAPQTGASAPGAAPEPPPDSEEQLPEAKPGFLRRVNPLNLFRKESPESFVRQGESSTENQNLALATIAFQKALALDADNVGAFKGLGNVFLRKGGRTNIATALSYYQEAVKRDPFDDQSYAMSAKIYERLGRMKEATLERKKMVVVKTLQADPANPIANNNMGILMLQQERLEQALDYFKKSIKSNPSYDIAYRNLAATHYKAALTESDDDKKSEQAALAKGYVAKALEIRKGVGSMLIQAKILVLEGRYDEALDIAVSAEEMEQANRDVYALKRQIFDKLNRTKDAQKAFELYQAFSKG